MSASDNEDKRDPQQPRGRQPSLPPAGAANSGSTAALYSSHPIVGGCLGDPPGGAGSGSRESEQGGKEGLWGGIRRPGPTGTYSVTPADQMSTLKPEKVSKPLAISGGWNAGEPWLVRHVSSSANGCRACDRAGGRGWGGVGGGVGWGGGSGSDPQGASDPPSHRQQSTSATPRSEILSVPPVVSSRLPGLMSLCTMPWLCRYSRPSTSWQKYLRGHGGHLGSPSRTKDRRSQLGSCWGQANRSNRMGGPSGNQGPKVRMSCFWALWPPTCLSQPSSPSSRSPSAQELYAIPHPPAQCSDLDTAM